jgi:hypothetical protein
VTAPPPRPAPPADPAEEAAWAALRARWDDPLAHRAWLSAIPDLAGLARAGARYRAVLLERPDDPVAAAGRDEVLRRATILGLAAAPRPARPPGMSPWVKYAFLGALALLAAGVAGGMALAFLRGGAGR